MTDEQRYVIQGRARDEAKKLQAEIATLQAFFNDYVERLEQTKNAITRFLTDTSARAPDGHPMFDFVNQLQRDLSQAGFWDATAELADKTSKLRKLEEQIKNF